MIDTSRLARSLGAAALVLIPFSTSAAGGDLIPQGGEFLVHEHTSYNQYWGRASTDREGTVYAVCFNNGQDVMARLLDGDGQPLTSSVLVHPNMTFHIQDECEVSLEEGGNWLVAFSDRAGYDGEQMGIFGRVYDPQGSPIGAEIQINQIWQASQWRPLIEPRVGGGWVVCWSGDWDGDAIMRLLAPDGSFDTDDIAIATHDGGAQTDTTVAVGASGDIFAVYVDYSGWGGVATGLNLWGRLFDSDGNPLQPLEFFLTPNMGDGDQREPRLASDGLGNYILVWQDPVHDGNGWGVFARRFGPDTTPLGPEFQVNLTTKGDQTNPRAAADQNGYFTIVWDDYSQHSKEVVARRFDAQEQPLTGEIRINQAAIGDQWRPSLAIPETGHEAFFIYEGPGDSTDVYGRFFDLDVGPWTYCTAKLNSAGCLPALGWAGEPTLAGPDDFHVLAGDVLNQRNGLLFHGLAPWALPWKGGTLCVQPPVIRSQVQSSGGNPPPSDCSGTFSFHFSQAWMVQKGLQAGERVYAQYWYRDPDHLDGTGVGLTDALSFTLMP